MTYAKVFRCRHNSKLCSYMNMPIMKQLKNLLLFLHNDFTSELIVWVMTLLLLSSEFRWWQQGPPKC